MASIIIHTTTATPPSTVHCPLSSPLSQMISTLLPLLYAILLPVALLSSLVFVTVIFHRYTFSKLRRRHHKASTDNNTSRTFVAFFHPHCSGGGGGERVLWKAIESISELNREMSEDYNDGHVRKTQKGERGVKKSLHVVIYTSDSKSDDYQRGKLAKVKVQLSNFNHQPLFFFCDFCACLINILNFSLS